MRPLRPARRGGARRCRTRSGRDDDVKCRRTPAGRDGLVRRTGNDGARRRCGRHEVWNVSPSL